MLVDVIKGVKQRSGAGFKGKNAHWPWKNPCATVWKELFDSERFGFNGNCRPL